MMLKIIRAFPKSKVFCLLVISLILLFPFLQKKSQAISYTGNFIFTTQSQINNFPISYPNCTQIIGDVSIGENASINSSILHVNGLSGIQQISGDLYIQNCSLLNNITGLSTLQSIGDDLLIFGTNSLANVNGLSNLFSVGTGIRIEANSSLLSLQGFNALDMVGIDGIQIINNPLLNSLQGHPNLTNISYYYVSQNPSLLSLQGLENLQFIGRLNLESNGITSMLGLNNSLTINMLSISDNDALPNINALNMLTSLQGLFIADNANLQNIHGLQNVANIGMDGIFIIDNPLLTNLQGLQNISSISGGALLITNNASLNSIQALSTITDIGFADIYIEQNNSLTSLHGIQNIDPYSITDVFIIDNLNLSTCHVQSICAKITIATSQVTIFGNAVGCATKPQVQTACIAQPSQITLKILLEGYYNSANTLKPVLLNQVVSNNSLNCDSVQVSVHQAFPPYAILSTKNVMLSTNGNCVAQFIPLNGMYYLSVKHRNALETWTAVPIYLSTIPAFYDFTDMASKAYGQNMKQIDPGVFALYSGDVNGDGNFDIADVLIVENDISNFASGYKATDVNGDGNVDLQDLPFVELNTNNFIYAQFP